MSSRYAGDEDGSLRSRRTAPPRRVLTSPAEPGAAARWVPAALAVAVVGLQIAYPLTADTTRDAVTIAIVATFFAASVSHAAAWRGLGFTVRLLLVTFGGGLAIEAIGVATGFPFGDYAYSGRLGPEVVGVPLVVAAAWTMMGYPALVVGRRITASRWLGPVVAGVALAAWDLFLDPQMVAEGHWTWAPTGGPHLIGEIPVGNFLAWLVVATLMMAALWRGSERGRVHGSRGRRARSSVGWASWSGEHDDRVPVALYLWTWAGSTLAHAVFLDLPQSALYGGVAMGAVVALLALRWLASRMGADPP